MIMTQNIKLYLNFVISSACSLHFSSKFTGSCHKKEHEPFLGCISHKKEPNMNASAAELLNFQKTVVIRLTDLASQILTQ
jgi:hypothetical protein